MKNKFKMSPETLREIEELALQLPKMAMADAKGEPQYRRLSKTQTGAEIIAEQRNRLKMLKQELNCNWMLKQYYWLKAWVKTLKPLKVAGEVVDPFTNYSQQYIEPIWVNHKTEMIEIYKKHGHQGLVQYVKYVTGKAAPEKEAKVLNLNQK
jgi:hypothetical protein